MRRATLPFLASTCWILASACGDAPPSAVLDIVARDSAGVTVIEQAGLPAVGYGDWSVNAEPELSVGSLEGSEEYQLYQVRGAARLDDGRMAVANAGSSTIRYYSRDGVFLGSEGGKGEGPGEYQGLQIVGRTSGDTLVIADFQNNRVSWVHPDAGFVRSFIANRDGNFGLVNGALEDGTVLLGGLVLFGGGDDVETGFRRDETEFQIADRTGEGRAILGRYPGPEMLISAGEADGGSWITARSLAFSRNTLSEAYADRIVLGTNDTYEVREYSTDGSLVRIIRDLTPPREVTSTYLDAYREEELAAIESEENRTLVQQQLRDMEAPPTFPAFDQLIVDRLGYLWVRDFTLPGEERGAWTVYDGGGMPVARLRTPEDLSILEIGADYVIGRFQDEFDVEYVRMHSLQRGADQP
jgi:hypothetical protein